MQHSRVTANRQAQSRNKRLWRTLGQQLAHPRLLRPGQIEKAVEHCQHQLMSLSQGDGAQGRVVCRATCQAEGQPQLAIQPQGAEPQVMRMFEHRQPFAAIHLHGELGRELMQARGSFQRLQQLLQALETTPRLHQLSAKFAVQLDGGEALAMLEHPHDLWLSALQLDGECWLAFGLAGCPAHDAPLGAVPLVQGHELVLAVLNRFLDLARPEQARMRQLLAEYSPEAFVAGLGLTIRRDPAVLQWRRTATAGSGYLGIYPQQQTGLSAVGAAAPLGRLNPSMLRGAAQLARERGDGSLRMTPWQSLLLPNIAQHHVAAVSNSLAQLGLLCCADEPLARLVACTGSSGCAKALAETKGDARVLATLLTRGAPASVHLSGCSRSCAMAHVAPATLLAQSPGHYDLYLRDAVLPGFGSLRARNLTLKEAGALLDARSRSTLDD